MKPPGTTLPFFKSLPLTRRPGNAGTESACVSGSGRTRSDGDGRRNAARRAFPRPAAIRHGSPFRDLPRLSERRTPGRTLFPREKTAQQRFRKKPARCPGTTSTSRRESKEKHCGSAAFRPANYGGSGEIISPEKRFLLPLPSPAGSGAEPRRLCRGAELCPARLFRLSLSFRAGREPAKTPGRRQSRGRAQGLLFGYGVIRLRSIRSGRGRRRLPRRTAVRAGRRR